MKTQHALASQHHLDKVLAELQHSVDTSQATTKFQSRDVWKNTLPLIVQALQGMHENMQNLESLVYKNNNASHGKTVGKATRRYARRSSVVAQVVKILENSREKSMNIDEILKEVKLLGHHVNRVNLYQQIYRAATTDLQGQLFMKNAKIWWQDSSKLRINS